MKDEMSAFAKKILMLAASSAFLCSASPKLELVPGYEVCSIYLTGCEAETESSMKVSLQYRKKGELNWRKADPFLSLVYIPREKALRGSLLDLSEKTAYEVLLKYCDNDKSGTLSGTFRTRGAAVPVAKTVVLDEKTRMPLQITQSGTPEGYIRYTMKKGIVLNGGKKKDFAVLLNRVSCVILDGLTVRGGKRHGIYVENCTEIQIVNCDVSGFGRVGKHRPDVNGMYYDEKNKRIDQDAGIRIRNSQNILVERNYVHDPRSTANGWFYDHPSGPNALNLGNVRGAAIRYNDFVGSDLHRWNDASEGADNGSLHGSACKDAEVTGNNFLFGNDDGMELDGGQISARFFRNRVEGFFCGVSLAPCLRGPSWCYRNLFCMNGAEFDLSNVAVKNIYGNKGVGYGRIFCLNNTVAGFCGGFSAFGGNKEAGDTLRLVSRNNVVSATKSVISRNLFRENRTDFDWDMMATLPGALDIPELRRSFNQEKNGIHAKPVFADAEHGNYRLRSGEGKGLGAFPQEDSPDLPYRPVSLSVSPARLCFKASSADQWQSQDVILHAEKETPFRIVLNEAFPFLKITPMKGVAGKGERITLKVSIDPAHIQRAMKYSSAFLVRLPDGFSRVVTVYADSSEDPGLLASDRSSAIQPVSVRSSGKNQWKIDFELKKDFRGYLFGRFSPGTSVTGISLMHNGKKTDKTKLRGSADVRKLPVWKNIGTGNLIPNPYMHLAQGKHSFVLTLRSGKLLKAALAEKPETFLHAPYSDLP